MPLYESTFIVRQDLSAQDTEKLADDFAAIIKDRKGRVVKREYWGLRNLAYKINKSRKGHYVMFGLDAPFDAVQEMERKLRLNEDVIRNLTVRVNKIPEGQSLMMKKEESSTKDI